MPAPPSNSPPDPAPAGRTSLAGLAYALAAFGVWGAFPIYFKALAPTSPLEVVCHRIIWSVPVVALMLHRHHAWGQWLEALKSPRVRRTLVLSALLVSGNWLGFVYAVESGQVLQSSLGYFINPLVNVVLSMVFLGERLRPWQKASVLLALAGTLTLALGHGQAPWLALYLAFSFALYGLLRKQVAIDALGGLLAETLFLAPASLACLVWLAARGELAFANAGWRLSLFLLAGGVVTSLPLVWFTRATRRISLTTVGICQYITPSLHLALAVFAYGEAFGAAHLAAFGLIWLGLALFMGELFLDLHRQRQPAA